MNPCFNLLEMAHMSILRALKPGGLAVDATAGNGHDTLFMAGLVGNEGLVLAFEIQEAALAATRMRLQQAGLEQQVRLLATGHENMAQYLAKLPPVNAAMFNLGFLPGQASGVAINNGPWEASSQPLSAGKVVTHPDTTLAALEALSLRLAKGGLISVHCYSGHVGGAEESRAVMAWAAQQPRQTWWVYRYDTFNKQHGPENLLLLERL